MKALDERLKKAYQDYLSTVKSNIAVEQFLKTLPPEMPYPSSGSIYEDMAFLYFNFEDVEELEIYILPSLSTLLNVKWEKEVNGTQVVYKCDFITDKEFQIYLRLNLLPSDTCQILKVPTGKTRMVSKTVDVEEMVYEYVVDCKEDN